MPINGNVSLVNIPILINGRIDTSVISLNIPRLDYFNTQLAGKQNILNGSESVFNSWDKNSGDDFNGVYSNLTGIPSTFLPSSHNHAVSDVTGLQSALDGKYDTPTGNISQYVRGNGSISTLPTYGSGTGISITGGPSYIISNTGDASSSNEGSITVSDVGGSPVYPDTRVAFNSNTTGSSAVLLYAKSGISVIKPSGLNWAQFKLQNYETASQNSYPVKSGDTLLWIPKPDLSLTGTTLSIGGGDNVFLSGWDTDNTDDVLVNSEFTGGNITGSFTSGLVVAQDGATNGQVLKWNNTLGQWKPGNDVSATLSDGNYGDITASSSGTVLSINNGLNATKIATGSVDNTEFGYLDGVTSSIQTQINGKFPTPVGTSVGQMLRYNGSAWEIFQPETRVTLASSQAISVVTETDITGLNASLISGKRYEIEVRLRYSAAATTTGIALAYTAPTGNVEHEYQVSTAATTTQGQNAFNSTALFVSTASRVTTNNNLAVARFLVTPTANGTFQMQAASEIAGSAITILAGSEVIIKEIL